MASQFDRLLASLVERIDKFLVDAKKADLESGGQRVVPLEDVANATSLKEHLTKYHHHKRARHLWCRRWKSDEIYLFLANVTLALVIAILIFLFVKFL
jgi:hypothetical protein